MVNQYDGFKGPQKHYYWSVTLVKTARYQGKNTKARQFLLARPVDSGMKGFVDILGRNWLARGESWPNFFQPYGPRRLG
jgi:hypothetical protein